MVGKLVDRIFDGSAGRLVAHIVEAGQLSGAELAELRALIDSNPKTNSRKAAKPQRKSI
jgi:predicted transcriptional regulator